MSKKPFGSNILNSVTFTEDTITDSINNPKPLDNPMTKTEEPVREEYALSEPAEKTSVAPEKENYSENDFKALQETKKAPRKGKVGKDVENCVERTRAINVPIPESIYKRLTIMKLNMPGESLKSLAARYIIEGLEKSEKKY